MLTNSYSEAKARSIMKYVVSKFELVN